MKIYSLFTGRHDLPDNSGAICESFDFTTNKAIKTPLWNELKENGGKLIVTGLTPALTEFLSDYTSFNYVPVDDVYHNARDFDADYNHAGLILLHYDKNSNSYWEQKF
jgi:hypothetical protein